MKFKVENTLTITVNNNSIPVATLPENLRKEIEHFDMLRQDQADAQYELDKVSMAIQYKNSVISQLLTAHFSPNPNVDDSKKNQTPEVVKPSGKKGKEVKTTPAV